MSRMLKLLLATFAGANACNRGAERPATTPPAAEPVHEPAPPAAASTRLPADAVAMVDGVAISDARFVEAYKDELRRRADPFRARPTDEREPVAHVIDALVYAELLRAELARLGTTSDGALTGAPQTLTAVLDVATPSHARTHRFSGLVIDELAVAVARGALTVSEAALAKAYEARARELVSTEGWLRFDALTVGFAGLAAGEVGVAACDEYIARARACAATLPERERADITAVVDDALKRWREQVADADRFAQLSFECSTTLEMVREEQAWSCMWTGALHAPRPLAKRKAAARRIAQALQRLAAAPGVDFATLASGRGLAVASRRRFEAIPHLAPALAAAVAKLAPGAVTPPMLDGDGWTIARVVERMPAGPAPLELRKDALVADIVRRQVAEALDGLFEELSAGREIVIRAPLPDPPAPSPKAVTDDP